MKKSYTKFSDEELDHLLEDLKFQLMRSHGSLAKGKKRKSGAKNIRRETARIKTEKTRRNKLHENISFE